MALTWAYVLLAPGAFLDDEYARWTAKIQLLDRCDLGELVILGDSRAAVAIAPRQLGIPATNLALAGGTGIEALNVVDRMLRCPIPPRRVILSISGFQLGEIGTFWDKSVRYGLLGWRDLGPLLARSRAIGDMSLYAGDRDGLPPLMKTVLHGVRFPSLYFNSLVQNGVVLRWSRNQAILRDVLAARGQYWFLGGTGRGSTAIVNEATLPSFNAPPILTDALDTLIARLAARGIAVDFVPIPVNQTSASVARAAYRAELGQYLADLARRHPNFTVLGDAFPAWPDLLFNDRFAHLNIDGTQRFSARLATCLAAAGSGPLADNEPCRAITRP